MTEYLNYPVTGPHAAQIWELMMWSEVQYV